ncbi:MAG: hypothetical protein Unbinned5081contig1003_25 [Prokaryotic dsDNA virus sp.]|nr:MAG: hypothetical protein Unbinned5081contig1003_25 [Prokaryotic dsDNA virus sp.]|tara:strand:- start:3467 stop:3691 length:225 start_codon:yes stop_codon:yes gene_type:complete
MSSFDTRLGNHLAHVEFSWDSYDYDSVELVSVKLYSRSKRVFLTEDILDILNDLIAEELQLKAWQILDEIKAAV